MGSAHCSVLSASATDLDGERVRVRNDAARQGYATAMLFGQTTAEGMTSTPSAFTSRAATALAADDRYVQDVAARAPEAGGTVHWDGARNPEAPGAYISIMSASEEGLP